MGFFGVFWDVEHRGVRTISGIDEEAEVRQGEGRPRGSVAHHAATRGCFFSEADTQPSREARERRSGWAALSLLQTVESAALIKVWRHLLEVAGKFVGKRCGPHQGRTRALGYWCEKVRRGAIKILGAKISGRRHPNWRHNDSVQLKRSDLAQQQATRRSARDE
jgi:hypothetical protein